MIDPPAPVPSMSGVRFDDLPVGVHFRPLRESIDDALCSDLGIRAAHDEGAPLAPPDVFPALFLRAYRDVLGGAMPEAVIAREELEFHQVVRIGTEVNIEVSISDKFVKQNRRYVAVEFGLADLHGTLLVSGRKIMAWPAEAFAGRG